MQENPSDPLLFLFPLSGLLWTAIVVWLMRWTGRKFSASNRWPSAPARFLDGKIGVYTDESVGAGPVSGVRVASTKRTLPDGEIASLLNTGFSTPTLWCVEVSFSYGAGYQGTFRSGPFQEPGPAGRLLENIKAGKMAVRYNPGNPRDYFIDAERDIRP
jgi:hypothetical protein